MLEAQASAPGKIILFGEHAVVYGQPALAVPVHDLQATATVQERARPGLLIRADDLGIGVRLAEDAAHALSQTARLVLDRLGCDEPDVEITIRSNIPVAAGLGSGAAVSAAVAQALSTYLGRPFETQELSALVYEVEKLHHGTPSGIDNTVICFGQPVYFVRDKSLELLHVGKPFQLVIGDTGISSPTRIAVGDVRAGWEREPERYNWLFEEIGKIVEKARRAIEQGQPDKLGSLMSDNHHLLRDMGVSSPELDRLVDAALSSGASGAKLSGGGRGGNMIALADESANLAVEDALAKAGAARVMHTTVR